MIFTLKQMQEKCKEQQRALYAVFIDFTKAFDTVSRETLLIILGRCGGSSHLIKLIQQYHIGMEAHISSKGQLSPPHRIVKGNLLAATTLLRFAL